MGQVLRVWAWTRRVDLMSWSIALANTAASLSMVFVVGVLSGVLLGVSSSIGLICVDSGGAEVCEEVMHAGDGNADHHARVE